MKQSGDSSVIDGPISSTGTWLSLSPRKQSAVPGSARSGPGREARRSGPFDGEDRDEIIKGEGERGPLGEP